MRQLPEMTHKEFYKALSRTGLEWFVVGSDGALRAFVEQGGEEIELDPLAAVLYSEKGILHDIDDFWHIGYRLGITHADEIADASDKRVPKTEHPWMREKLIRACFGE